MKSINEWQTREVTIFNHVEVMGIALDVIEVIFSKKYLVIFNLHLCFEEGCFIIFSK
jgi:hypothetical protein